MNSLKLQIKTLEETDANNKQNLLLLEKEIQNSKKLVTNYKLQINEFNENKLNDDIRIQELEYQIKEIEKDTRKWKLNYECNYLNDEKSETELKNIQEKASNETSKNCNK